ncbi:Hypothetical_protein [Hexamita inflata]|uniref:Hypothetical_protein n=1 Tax=Hexamita inflata TaxID=28002 RepID=A0AA86UTV8_9EUKA|nr:Hypothetical protein HINF_LOCUS37158 [Hexamita inflata]
MLTLIAQIFTDSMSDCGWMTQGRMWSPMQPCIIEDQIDLGKWKNYGMNINGVATPDMDMTVVNVNRLSNLKQFDDNNNTSIFSLTMMDSEASISNALLIFNVTIDCDQKKDPTDILLISVFDSMFGKLSNISITGQINLKNFQIEKYKEVRLSRFFGNVGLQTDDRFIDNSTSSDQMLNNLNSSLRFIIDDNHEVKRLKNGSVVLQSINPLVQNIVNQTLLSRMKLLTCFDSLLDINGNEYPDVPIISTEPFTEAELNLTELENPYDTPEAVGMDIFVPQISPEKLEIISKFPQINITITDALTDSSYVVPITINFDYKKNPNAAHDFYTRSLVKTNDITHETDGLAEFYYNKKGIKQDFINPQEPEVRVFVSATKTVALWDEQVLICTDGKMFDVVNLSCVDTCEMAKGKFRFQAMCTAQCPDSFYQIVDATLTHCYFDCPIHLGYVNPADNANTSDCIKCGLGEFASPRGCLGNQGSMWQFQKGYFSECPPGLDKHDDDKTCTEPTNCMQNLWLIDVHDHPLSLQKNLELYSYCSDRLYNAAGLHRVMQQNGTNRDLTNRYTWKCETGIEFMNGTCLSSADSTKEDCVASQQDTFDSYSDAALNYNNSALIVCEVMCINGKVNSNGECSDDCEIPLYKQERFGSCNPCVSDIYDGGSYYNRASKKCVVECFNYSIDTKTSANKSPFDQSPRICEQDCSGSLPKRWMHNLTTPITVDGKLVSYNWQCLATCDSVNLLDQDDKCVEQCDPGYLIGEDGKTCVKACQQVIVNDVPREGFYRMVRQIGTKLNETGFWQGQCETLPACQIDQQTIDLKVNNISFRCMDTCNTGFISDRYFNCVPIDNCSFVDRLPKPLFCEEKNDSTHCSYYRKTDLITDRKVYVCQIDNCKDSEKVYQNQECVTSCSAHEQYQQLNSKVCGETCASGIFSKVYQDENGTQVSNDTSRFEYQCVDSCPIPKAKVNMSIFDQDLQQCEDTCQAIYGADKKELFVQADQTCANCIYLNVSFEPPMCVNNCTLTQFSPQLNKFICVDVCPEGTYLYNNDSVQTCVSSCLALNMSVSSDNLTCVAECVFYKKMFNESYCDICKDEDNYVRLDDGKTYCYDVCPGYKSYDPSTNTCVQKCPNGQYSYYYLCLDKCPQGYAPANGFCIVSSNKVQNWLYIVFIGIAVVVISVIIIIAIMASKKRRQQTKLKTENRLNKNTMYFARHLDNKVNLTKQQTSIQRTVKKIGMNVEMIDRSKSKTSPKQAKTVEMMNYTDDVLNTSGSGSSGIKKNSSKDQSSTKESSSNRSSNSGRDSGSGSSVKIAIKKPQGKMVEGVGKRKAPSQQLISAIKNDKTGKKRLGGKLDTMVL